MWGSDAPAGTTFAGQEKLPKLPLPPLEDTCARFVTTVTPLLSEAELEGTRKTVAQDASGAPPPPPLRDIANRA